MTAPRDRGVAAVVVVAAALLLVTPFDLAEQERTAAPLLVAHAVEVSHADDVAPFSKVIRVQDFMETRECYQ